MTSPTGCASGSPDRGPKSPDGVATEGGGGDANAPSAGERKAGDLLAEGSPAPALATTDHRGEMVDLTQLGGTITVVYFYPRDDTPGCTAEACAFRDAWTRFQDAGVKIIGVSVDSNESHAEFATKHELPFGLIADEDRRWAKAFGVGMMMGMTKRVSFLIGPDGTIAKVYPGVDPGVHADQVLEDAAGL